MASIKEGTYVGKEVFVGMDVHKKKYVITAISEGVVVKRWTVVAIPEKVAVQLLSFFKGARIKSAYEAGFSGFKLHRTLVRNNIENIVVNPASIEVESNNRVKTDKKDAKKLTEQLAAGRLRGIYVPTEEEEAHRSLTRGRGQAIERRKAIGNQLKGKLHYLGFILPDDKKVSESFMEWVQDNVKVEPEHAFAINELIDAWRQESKRIKRFDEEMKKQAASDSLDEIYRSAPGIGPVSARTLSNELGDMTRFDNERQLFSNSGLTPGEYSSGEHIRRGHISRQGSPLIRGLLVEVAWRAIAVDDSLKEFYLRIARQRDGKRAIVAVARKILGRLRHCLKNRVNWKDTSVAAA